MCGIAGILSKSESVQVKVIVEQMTRAVKHRGPDDGATYVLTAAGG